jgi:hypothetical protein
VDPGQRFRDGAAPQNLKVFGYSGRFPGQSKYDEIWGSNVTSLLDIQATWTLWWSQFLQKEFFLSFEAAARKVKAATV